MNHGGHRQRDDHFQYELVEYKSEDEKDMKERLSSFVHGEIVRNGYIIRRYNNVSTYNISLEEFYDEMKIAISHAPHRVINIRIYSRTSYEDEEGKIRFVPEKGMCLRKNDFDDKENALEILRRMIIEKISLGDSGFPDSFTLADINRKRFDVYMIDESKKGGYHSMIKIMSGFEVYEIDPSSHGISYNDNDCLFIALNESTRKRHKPSQLRDHLEYDETSMIKCSKKTIEYLEEKYNCSIDVYQSYDEIKRTYKMYHVSKKKENLIDILLTQRHYYLVKRIIKHDEKEKDESDERKRINIAFDFETVGDVVTGEVIPWCVSFQSTESKFNHLIKNHDIMKFKECFNAYMNMITSHDASFTLFGWNNAKYDNYIFIKLLNDPQKIKAITLSKGRIIMMKYSYNITIKDLKLLLPCDSLSSAKECFDLKIGKLELDHSMIQKAYSDGKDSFIDIIERENEMIDKYVMRDSRLILDIIEKADDIFKKNYGMKITNSITLGAHSYRRFTSKKKMKDIIDEVNEINIDKKLRKCIIGGRCQAFEIGEFKKCSMYDVNSLYPHVLLENHYPIGKCKKTDEYVDGFLGIYKVKIKSQPEINIIPIKDDDVLDWESERTCIRWITSVSLKMLMKRKCKIGVLNGFFWPESSDELFDEYFEMPLKIKKESKNKVEKFIAKLYANSLTGKFVENVERESLIVLNNENKLYTIEEHFKALEIFELGDDSNPLSFCICDMKNASDELKERAKKKLNVMIPKKRPLVWGVFMYEYARKHLYEMIEKCDRPLYCDTDSIIVKDNDEFNEVVRCGNKIGQLKKEFENMRCLILGKKMYAVYDDEKKEIIKLSLKGIRRDSPCLTESEFKKEFEDDIHSIEINDIGHFMFSEMHKKYNDMIVKYPITYKKLKKMIKQPLYFIEFRVKKSLFNSLKRMIAHEYVIVKIGS